MPKYQVYAESREQWYDVEPYPPNAYYDNIRYQKDAEEGLRNFLGKKIWCESDYDLLKNPVFLVRIENEEDPTKWSVFQVTHIPGRAFEIQQIRGQPYSNDWQKNFKSLKNVEPIKPVDISNFNHPDIPDEQWFWYEYKQRPHSGVGSCFADDHVFLACVVKEEELPEFGDVLGLLGARRISYGDVQQRFSERDKWVARLIYSLQKATTANHASGYYNQ